MEASKILQKLKRHQRFHLKASCQPTNHDFLTATPIFNTTAAMQRMWTRPKYSTCFSIKRVWEQLSKSSYFDGVFLLVGSRRDGPSPSRTSAWKVYIATCSSPPNPPRSLYGSGLAVKPMSWQGHEIQYTVFGPFSACPIKNNPPSKILICILTNKT